MTEQMVNTVNERVALMVKNVEIQNIMMKFSTKEEAQDWIIEAAIATLLGVQNK